VRVVHTIPSVAEESSGPSYSVVRLCESLVRHDVLLTLCALDFPPVRERQPFLRLFSGGIGPRRLGQSFELDRWLNDQAGRGGVDLLHNHSLWMMPNVYPGRIARRHGTPLVVSPRGTLSGWAMSSGSRVKRVFWPLVQLPALEPTTCFHATARSEYEDVRRAGFKQPVAVIPNGIDLPPVLQHEPADTRTVLFLGRVHPTKGLDMLLPAWRAVEQRFQEWRLDIVGPDNNGYLDQMMSLASDLGLTRVRFVGPLHGEAKRAAYSAADLFVLPTYSENFGMAVAEALAAGTPVIVTKGAPWAGVDSHRAGWWIDIGVDALVAGLETAMSRSRDELRQMGARGREWMAAEFAWEQIARQVVET